MRSRYNSVSQLLNKFYSIRTKALIIVLLLLMSAKGWTQPFATISGSNSICRNSTSPFITFTGTDGTAPYTFTYKINNGADQYISTSGSSNIVTVPVPTGSAGIYTYSLNSVSDFMNQTNIQSGSAIITVIELPTVGITGSSSIYAGGTTTLSPVSGGIWTSNKITVNTAPAGGEGGGVPPPDPRDPTVARVTNAGIVTGVRSGVATFTFTETLTGCKNTTVEVRVINPPKIAEGPGPLTITCDEDNSPNSFSLTLHAIEIDGNTISWSISSQAADGIAIAAGTGTTNAISYTPSLNFNGSDAFVVSISDGQGGTDNLTVNVQVNSVNDAPSFTKGSNQTIAENARAQTVAAWATAISAGPPDESAQTLAFTVINDNNALFSAQPAIAPNGTLTYTPAANARGSTILTVYLKDNGGTLNGGVDQSISQTFSITVNQIPDAITGEDRAICNYSSTTIGAVAIEGHTYSWTSLPSGFTSTVSNPTVSPSLTTTYTLVETITATGTTNSNIVTVTVNPNPLPITGITNICTGTESNLTSATTGGTWSSASPLIASINALNGLVTGIAQGNSIITYTLTTGCSVTTSVNVNPLPVVSLICSDADHTFYEGAKITFTATGGILYNFRVNGISVQNSTSNSFTTNTLTDGQVMSVIVTNESGCSKISDGVMVNVVALPSGWELNSSNYAYEGQVIAEVFVNHNSVVSGYLAAFAGTECRGIEESKYYSQTDHYIFYIKFYSNSISGESLTFKYYDPLSGKTYDLNKTLVFNNGIVSGSPDTPIEMNNTIQINKPLSVGWNWFSVNAQSDNMTPESLLPEVITNGDYIKDQFGSSTFYSSFGWFGSLTEIDPAKLYKIKIQSNCNFNFTGVPVDVNLTSLPLVSGWNWIGYIPQSAQTISDALSSLSLLDGDYIKNQTASATYYSGFGWFGSLSQLSPQDGYMMKVTNPGTLKYSNVQSKNASEISSCVSETLINPAEYEFSGSVTAKIIMDGKNVGSTHDTLFTYVNNQLRGYSASYFFEPLGIYLFPVMTFSNSSDGENIEFRYYSSLDNKIYTCNESLPFVKDMIISDAFHPLVLIIYSNPAKEIPENQNGNLEIKAYPNPFEDVLNIEYSIPELNHVTISIHNSDGKLIQVLTDEQQNPGKYSIKWNASSKLSGIYFIRLRTSMNQKYQKVVKMR